MQIYGNRLLQLAMIAANFAAVLSGDRNFDICDRNLDPDIKVGDYVRFIENDGRAWALTGRTTTRRVTHVQVIDSRFYVIGFKPKEETGFVAVNAGTPLPVLTWAESRFELRKITYLVEDEEPLFPSWMEQAMQRIAEQLRHRLLVDQCIAFANAASNVCTVRDSAGHPIAWIFKDREPLKLKPCPRCDEEGNANLTTYPNGHVSLQCGCGYHVGATAFIHALRHWNREFDHAEKQRDEALTAAVRYQIDQDFKRYLPGLFA